MGRFKVWLLLFFILMCFPLLTFAGNVDTFGIGSKATALGGAYAAYADGPFAVYYNPAGLVQIKRPMVSVGSEFMDPTLKVYDFKARDWQGNEVQPYNKTLTDTSPTLWIPFAGFVIPINDRFVFGMATYVPYGLHIKWRSYGNAGMYNSFESYYMRIVTTPTIAYKITDNLFVGFGISIGRSYSGSERRIYAPSLPSLNNRVIKGNFKDAVNYSYNVGIMYKPIKQITLGLTYRSMAHTHFSGTVEVEGIQRVGADTSIDHPDQIQAGIRYTPNDRLSFEADVLWTHWDVVDGYTIHFNHPLLGTTYEEYYPRAWKNTTQFKFGAEWKASKLLTLRAGYYYDKSPIPTDTFDLLWPDGNKSTYCAGLGLNFGRFSIDAAIQYIIAQGHRYIRGDSKDLNDSYSNPITGQPGSVSAKTFGHLWGYSLTLNYTF